MSRPSRLHVPRPPARPGEAPDFGYVRLSPAGAVARPDVAAAAAEIENLSVDLIRVLDDEHRARGPWDPRLDVHELQVGLRHMVLTRLYDDRMLKTQRQGKIDSFYMKSTGEEAVAVAWQPWRCVRPTCCSPRIASRARIWCAAPGSST